MTTITPCPVEAFDASPKDDLLPFSARLADKGREWYHAFHTSLRKATGWSDYGRWSGEANLARSWDARTRQIGALIRPKTTVIEFGAGRLVLKTQLPEGCAYTPCDLVDRGCGTIVCDLNARVLPRFPAHDVAVFSGVLEYVNDVPRLVAHLAGTVQTIIASYAVKESNRRYRRSYGWVNDYTSAELVDVFEREGYRRERDETWESQVIYEFTKIRRIRAAKDAPRQSAT